MYGVLVQQTDKCVCDYLMHSQREDLIQSCDYLQYVQSFELEKKMSTLSSKYIDPDFFYNLKTNHKQYSGVKPISRLPIAFSLPGPMIINIHRCYTYYFLQDRAGIKCEEKLNTF